MKKVYLVSVIISGLFLASCESTTYDNVEGFVANPTYEKNIKPLIDSKCNNCHAAQVTYQLGGGTILDNYADFRSSVEFGYTLRDINTLRNTPGQMPKSNAPLTKGQIKLIYAWKNTGFPQ
jgi:uncharacterized membrane protein